MAGDWLHISKGLKNKPEVLSMARSLGRSREEVVGMLVSVWDWFDSETTDGKTHVEPDDIAAASCVPVQLLFEMKRENWLSETRGRTVVPRFERWMGSSAKKRHANALRKQKERSKTSRFSRDKKRTKARPEKSRDERERRDERRGEMPSPLRVDGDGKEEDASPIGDVSTGKPSTPPIDPSDVVNRWNILAQEQGLPPIRGLNATRRRKLSARLRESPGFWDELVEAVRSRGAWAREGGFPGFDQVLQASTWQKLIEGFYGERRGKPQNVMRPKNAEVFGRLWEKHGGKR